LHSSNANFDYQNLLNANSHLFYQLERNAMV